MGMFSIMLSLHIRSSPQKSHPEVDTQLSLYTSLCFGNFNVPWQVSTMDHEVGLQLCKAVDWLLMLSWDNFGSHQEKMAKELWRSRPPKYNFRGIDMVQHVLR